MKPYYRILIAGLSAFLLAFNTLAAETALPAMPTGGPDNGTFDKSGRYPAGTTKHTSFYSSVAGKSVDMWVYTPPGYSTSQTYGVIFCYQGISTDAGTIFYDWCVNAPIVCDNLIGEGKISKGVIIVAIDDQFDGNYSNVRDMTIKDAIPYIDSHYSTYGDADHRGLYGYSWGGGYTFNVGCENLDYFHYLSPTSAAPNKAADNTLFPNGGAKAKQVLKCLFLSWGQNDYQSIIDANVACDSYCTTNKIPHYKWVAAGQGHTAGTWRPAMWNFLQLADQAGISGILVDEDIPTCQEAFVSNQNPRQIQVIMSRSIKQAASYNGFTVKVDNQVVTVDSIVLKEAGQLVFYLNDSIHKDNAVLLSYGSGNLVSLDDKALAGFSNKLVDNLLEGSSPRLADLKTNLGGDTLIATFNKKMNLPTDITALTLSATYNGTINIPFSHVSYYRNDSTLLAIALDTVVYADYGLLFSYSGNNLVSSDSGLLKPFSDVQATNYANGLPVILTDGKIEYDGTSGVFEFSKTLSASVNKAAFTLKVNGKTTAFKDFFVLKNMIRFTLANTLHYGDTIKASYTPGNVMAADSGLLDAFSDYLFKNQIKEPTWLEIPAKIEAENYYSQSGVQTETTSDTGGGSNIGYVDSGDWFDYAITNNNSNALFEVAFRVASTSSTSKFDVYLDNTKLTQISVPNTGGYQVWQSVVKKLTIGQGKHYLKIVAVNGGFNVNYYNISQVVSSIENGQDVSLKIYPNPLSRVMTISSPGFSYNKVEIIDLMGKPVFSQLVAYESTLHVQLNLPNGMYLVKLSGENQFYVKRIIVDNK